MNAETRTRVAALLREAVAADELIGDAADRFGFDGDETLLACEVHCEAVWEMKSAYEPLNSEHRRRTYLRAADLIESGDWPEVDH